MAVTKVDAAVEAIDRLDPSLGEWAHVAADGLTAGEGAGALCQAFVYRLRDRARGRRGHARAFGLLEGGGRTAA